MTSMKLTFELTTRSPEDYLTILSVLDDAVRRSELANYEMRPRPKSLPALAAHALKKEAR